MFNEPHYPSKWTVVTVFSVLLLLIIGVFAWAFYFNLGTILVRSDRSFVLEGAAEAITCDQASCEMRLPPGSYDFIAHADGYYDESFRVVLERWTLAEKTLDFELIPFLQELQLSEIPEEDPLPVSLQFRSGKMQLISLENDEERILTDFESLREPLVRVGGNQIVVVDEGRLFFVDLESGRKLRRFDDSVYVNDAFVSDNGNRILLFVRMEDVDHLWLWFTESSELVPLLWYAPPSLLQWESDVEHRIYVITDQLQESDDPSLFADILDRAEITVSTLQLFQYNLDTGEARSIRDFSGKVPTDLLHRGGRYFVQYEEGDFEELVVR